MNYLAHAYLSFDSPDILAGNLISDFVKGRKKFEYSTGIQKGIALHREIDRFTDAHEAAIAAKQYFKPSYRLYSAAFVDVVFDHFLASDPNEFTEKKLMQFTQETYRQLDMYEAIFPDKFQVMFPYMKNQNWLFNYRFRQGIEKSFGGLVRRAAYLTESESANRIFEESYLDLQQCYLDFFPDLKEIATEMFNKISEKS